jgi:hypothetical protein
MVRARREKLPEFLQEPFLDGTSDKPLFRHGQPPLHQQAYAKIAELIATPPAGEVNYWTFKMLTEQVSQTIKA